MLPFGEARHHEEIKLAMSIVYRDRESDRENGGEGEEKVDSEREKEKESERHLITSPFFARGLR